LEVKRQQRLQETGLQLTLKGKLREVDWETMVGRLKSFYMLYGHCRVHEHEGEELLEQWVQVQQMKEMRGTLSQEKQALLNSLGISWRSSWLESWKQLCLMKQQHGRIRVLDLKHAKRTLPLYMWLRNQRLMEAEGALDKQRIEMLSRLGCRWQGLEEADCDMVLGASLLDRYLVWEPRFNQLVLFRQMHGHCDMAALFLHETRPPHTVKDAHDNDFSGAEGACACCGGALLRGRPKAAQEQHKSARRRQGKARGSNLWCVRVSRLVTCETVGAAELAAVRVAEARGSCEARREQPK